MKISINNLVRRTIAAALIVVSILAVGIIALTIPVGFQQTWSMVLVNNSDMEPSIPKGSLVISEKVASSSIKEGDIVTLNSTTGSSVATVSRIVSTTPAENNKKFFYQVQGDNTIVPDGWSYQVGEKSYKLMTSIPVVGFIATPLNNSAGAIIFAFLIIGLSWVFLTRFYQAPVVEKAPVVEANEGIEEIKEIFAELGVEVKSYEKKTRKQRKEEDVTQIA
jgi:signal peptidase